MSRPRKSRKVCSMPENSGFSPLNITEAKERVQMSVDEYETIRLIDLAGYTQEECAKQMKIARTTVQAMYNEARKKIADALVNSKELNIEGGNYDICDAEDCNCGNNCTCLREKTEKGEEE